MLDSHDQVDKVTDIVLLEGISHCAFGSIVGVNNVKVARILSADTVFVGCKLGEKERWNKRYKEYSNEIEAHEYW